MVAGQQDKTFVKTFVGVMAFLFAVMIFLIVLAVTVGGDPNPEQLALERERAEQRLQPLAAVRLSGEPMPEVAAAPAPAAAAGDAAGGAMSAEQIVAQVCAACHDAGVLGAPKTGTAADWEPRMAQGLDTVVQNAINGIRAMPPRGGNPNLSDEEVHDAVVYMLEQSGVSVE